MLWVYPRGLWELVDWILSKHFPPIGPWGQTLFPRSYVESGSFSNFWQLAFGSSGYPRKRTSLANVPMNSDVTDKNKSWKQWWNSSIKDSLAYLKFLLGNSYVEVPCGQHPEREEAQDLMCVCWTPGSGGTKINKPQDLPSSNSHSSRGDWHKSKHSSKIIN